MRNKVMSLLPWQLIGVAMAVLGMDKALGLTFLLCNLKFVALEPNDSVMMFTKTYIAAFCAVYCPCL